MTLPVSGPISLSQIATEFGGAAPHSLSEYYRGGGLVPDIAANSNVPTSGPISISQFYGATVTPPITITMNSGGMGGWGTHAALGAQSASCTLIFASDGNLIVVLGGQAEIGNTLDTTNMWARPVTTNIGANYWIRATLQTGPTPTGTMNTWLNLGTNRQWGVSRTQAEGVGSDVSAVQFQIATDSAGNNIVASCIITMSGRRA